MPWPTVSTKGRLTIILIPLVTICLCLMSSFFSILHKVINTNDANNANYTANGKHTGSPSNPHVGGNGDNVALKFGSEGAGPGFFNDRNELFIAAHASHQAHRQQALRHWQARRDAHPH